MFASVSLAISACVLDYVDIRSPPIINIMAGSICNFSSFPPFFFVLLGINWSVMLQSPESVSLLSLLMNYLYYSHCKKRGELGILLN